MSGMFYNQNRFFLNVASPSMLGVQTIQGQGEEKEKRDKENQIAQNAMDTQKFNEQVAWNDAQPKPPTRAELIADKIRKQRAAAESLYAATTQGNTLGAKSLLGA